MITASMPLVHQNPTPIESAHPDPGEKRLDQISGKDERKEDAPGAFGKLLAGLLSKNKKTQPEDMNVQTEASESKGKDKLLRLSENEKHQIPWTKDEKALLHAFSKGESTSKDAALKEAGNKQKKSKQNEGDLVNLNQDGPETLNLANARIQKETSEQTEKNLFLNTAEESAGLGHQKEAADRIPSLKKRELPDSVLLEAELKAASLRSKEQAKISEAQDGNKGESKKAAFKREKASSDKPALQVHDLRTQTGTEAEMVADQGLRSVEAIRNESVQEVTLDLKFSGEGNRTASVATDMTVQSGETFSQLLARELNGSLSTDIVRQALVILRDNGEGTIKLSLRPESLGKVKIHLEMAENKIIGQIVVENEEVLKAFEQEIHSLEQSFKDSGYEATLNAALDYRNSGQRWKEEQVNPFYSERLVSDSYDEFNAAEFSGGYNYGNEFSEINLLV